MKLKGGSSSPKFYGAGKKLLRPLSVVRKKKKIFFIRGSGGGLDGVPIRGGFTRRTRGTEPERCPNRGGIGILPRGMRERRENFAKRKNPARPKQSKIPPPFCRFPVPHQRPLQALPCPKKVSIFP